MITPRTVTEQRLVLGLHHTPLTPQTVDALYPHPYTITAHVHRALREWEAEGLVIASQTPAGPAYAPAHIDPHWRRAALVSRMDTVHAARADLMNWLAACTQQIADLANNLTAEVPEGDAGLDRQVDDAREYLRFLQGAQYARARLARLDQDETIIRAEAIAAGFDPDAVCAGQPDIVAQGADPLGVGA